MEAQARITLPLLLKHTERYKSIRQYFERLKKRLKRHKKDAELKDSDLEQALANELPQDQAIELANFVAYNDAFVKTVNTWNTLVISPDTFDPTLLHYAVNNPKTGTLYIFDAFCPFEYKVCSLEAYVLKNNANCADKPNLDEVKHLLNEIYCVEGEIKKLDDCINDRYSSRLDEIALSIATGFIIFWPLLDILRKERVPKWQTEKESLWTEKLGYYKELNSLLGLNYNHKLGKTAFDILQNELRECDKKAF